MAEKEVITIESVTKYGGRVNGKNYNLSKKYTGPALEAGKTYETEIYTSANGAKYINVAKESASPAIAPKTVDTAKTVNTGDANPPRVNGSALAPAQKDNRILVQGVTQSVVGAPYLAGAENDEDFIARVIRISNALVEHVKGA